MEPTQSLFGAIDSAAEAEADAGADADALAGRLISHGAVKRRVNPGDRRTAAAPFVGE